uniref:Protein BONZAI 3-like n=1 Tax=Nelumbo nucifera TaxID=4432 RepID=A0A822YNC1_NELNU|nr:TPA_asm: hypothetical protein HUJ06_004730 [Nelumbo nucifera]
MLKLEEQQFLGEAACSLSEVMPSVILLWDPFLVISKSVENGLSIPVCNAEVKKNDLNPTWKPAHLLLCKDNPLTIECFNFNNNGKHDLIGKVQKSLADLEKLQTSQQGENLFLHSTVGNNYHNKVLKSRLFVDKFSESVQHTFLDYVAGGCELNFMVAIDFTGKVILNTLHYIDPSGRPNAYQRRYCNFMIQISDFQPGARPIDGPVSHCFNLNGSSYNCEVKDSLFGPVINTAATIASHSLARSQQKYYVLLIMTDVVVTNLQETKDALVKASNLPLSILIVGVGGADFKVMEALDADKGERLESTIGRVASRDIVQFVPFRQVQDGEISIVQSLLAELSGQFVTYMRARDIHPCS